MSSQNLVCFPSLISKDPQAKTSSLIFINPLQKWESFGLAWTCSRDFELKYLFLSKDCQIYGRGETSIGPANSSSFSISALEAPEFRQSSFRDNFVVLHGICSEALASWGLSFTKNLLGWKMLFRLFLFQWAIGLYWASIRFRWCSFFYVILNNYSKYNLRSCSFTSCWAE